MRVLLDECVNPRVRAALPDHNVKTVIDMSWQGTTNGKLLTLAEAEGFEVFVTVDRNLSYQQNVAARGLGLVVVRVKSNHINAYVPIFSKLNRAVETVAVGQTIYVSE